MIEKEFLKEGRLINFDATLLQHRLAPGVQPGGQPIGFVAEAPRRIGDAAHHGFHWLHYVQCWMNHVPFAGVDVLSGDFSGCWMIYFLLGGSQRVGHLGLPQNNPAGAATAKANWQNFVGTQHAVDVNQFRAFRPSDILAANPKVLAAPTPHGPVKFLGLMTAERRCFAVAIVPARSVMAPPGHGHAFAHTVITGWKVVAVVHVDAGHLYSNLRGPPAGVFPP